MIKVRQGQDLKQKIKLVDGGTDVNVGIDTTSPPIVNQIVVTLCNAQNPGAVGFQQYYSYSLNQTITNTGLLTLDSVDPFSINLKLEREQTKNFRPGQLWAHIDIKFNDPDFSPDGRDYPFVQHIGHVFEAGVGSVIPN